ncbi:MAG: hypothetical protein AB8I08_04095 [Sandaracinaceae bacterium]
MGKVFYEDDDATFVQDRNLLIAIYRGCPTVTHIRVLRAEFQRQAENWPDGVAVLVAVHAEGWVPRFDEGFRNEIHEMVVETERSSLGTAFVLTGHGMVTSGLRAFVNGVFLLSRSREPNRVFADLSTAVTWLANLPGVDSQWSAGELVDCGLTYGIGGQLRRAS